MVAGQLDQPTEIESAALVGQFNISFLTAQPDQPIKDDQVEQPDNLQVQLDQSSEAVELDQQGHPVSCSFDETCESMTVDQLLADTLPSDCQDCSEEVDMEESELLDD